MSGGNLISREELLGGFRGGDKRRAGVALVLIKARAARLAVERGTVKAPFMTEDALKERSRAYLGAFVEGAKATTRVSIQDLERSAPAWNLLVSDKPTIRAELARRISEQYRFTRRHIPQIAAALGLDDPAVQAAYEALGDGSLATIYRERLSPTEQLRWAWSELSAKIESLPPFWTAFALTITETVGAGALALPIAFATVGPLAGVVVLLVLGLINLLTVAYLAEASARSGSIRYGSAFVGRLVHDYLGVPASVLLRITLFVHCCISLAVCYIGFASTVSAVTGIPAPFWVAVVFATGLFLILRRSLVGTLASALLIGLINISILISLSFMALGHATSENLLHMEVPFLDGGVFEASHLELVFGIVLVSYFGHLSVSNCAQAVLRRDPDGRSLKRGTIAAMAVAIAIYCLWSVSVGGAVGSEKLLGERETALVPLAAQVGPEIYVLGVVFAVLGLGMSSIHFGLGIFNMSRELTENVKIRPEKSWLRDHAEMLIALLPILLVFGYVQWSYIHGTPSFTAPLELLGAILTPILAGIFPVLLLMASRARGLAVRGARLPIAASNRLVLGFVVLLSLAGLLLHGFVIWDDPVSRAAAFVAAAIMLCLIADLIRRRAFSPVLQITIRYFPEDDHSAEVLVAFRGNTIDANLSIWQVDGSERKLPRDGPLRNFHECESIDFDLPLESNLGVQIDAHKVSADFEAEPIEGWLTYLPGDSEEHPIELDSISGLTRLVIPAQERRGELHLRCT